MALCGAAHFTVVNRNVARGGELVDLLNGKVRAETGRDLTAELVPWRGDHAVAAATDIVVDATSIGLYPDVDERLPLDVGTLAPGMIVVDVIPNPPRTRLVRDAAARGCQVIDGLAMLVGQGRIGIAYWTGIEPDESVMRQALEEVFGAG
jgi:shikimate dehydrogenase